MTHKNTKLTTLEPQTTYRVVLLRRYGRSTISATNAYHASKIPVKTYVSGGKEYKYQSFELWGPYLSLSKAQVGARSAGSYEILLYTEDFDVIIEACEPEWVRVDLT